MFWDVVKFELTYRFRRPVVYLFAGMFFMMTFGAIASDSMQLGGAIGNAARNAPFEVVRLLSMMSVMGLLALTGFVATAVNRDHEYKTSEFFLATPTSKSSYLLGRFTGALVTAMVAVCASALGIVVASWMPWLDPERILPFDARPYVYALSVYVLPNLLCAGALLFAFATLTRRVLFTYIAMIGFLMFWAIGQATLGDLDATTVGAMLDPFGKTSLDLATRYWTVVEKNSLLPAFTGMVALNRLLWTAVGLGALGFTVARFRMGVVEERSRPDRAREASAADGAAGAGRARAFARRSGLPNLAFTSDGAVAVPEPRPVLDFSLRSRVAQWMEQTRVEVGGIIRSVPFLVILCFGIFNLLGGLIPEIGSAGSYPITRNMLQTIEGTYTIFLFIFVLVFAGQLVWREKSASMHEIQGALPVPDWVPLVSKLTGLLVVTLAALALAMVVTIVYQAVNGYFNFEIGLYLRGLFLVQMPAWYLIAALAIATQVFTGNKIAGFGVMVIFFILQEVIGTIGLEHNLWFYGEYPSPIYSDMNGYGHFVRPLFWFFLYWGLVATALLILSVLFWVRGTDVRGMGRFREARRRLTGPRLAALATTLAAVVVVGSWIFYNTNVLNEFRSAKLESKRAALFEERYKQYEDLPQPKVTDVRMAVDIYPEERRVAIHGDLMLVNKTDEVIEELHVIPTERLEVDRFSVIVDPPVELWESVVLGEERGEGETRGRSGATVRVEDEETGYTIYDLDEPLAPGEALVVSYDARIENPGFENDRANTRVVENGTFLDTYQCVPVFGYDDDFELSDAHERKRHDLPEREDMPEPDDPRGSRYTMTHDADWVTYDAVVSTSADQVALTAGYLEREWKEGGRRYFHYAMDIPILHFFPFVSGRYAVARDAWNDIPVEVYYHPSHEYNVARMIESVKASLEYYTTNYGPYQHYAVRVVEFPRYQSFAQSFSTIIPYSESIHFVEDLRDPEHLDMVYYVTAHEVAHQWWGHQVCVAWTRGGYFVEESLAQYSALMVMEQDLGREHMEKFLRYELDKYLRGRGHEREEELPLAYCEHQPYLYYSKGSLAMYALRDYIGEDRVNQALRKYVAENAFVGPPFPNSLGLIEALREVTPEEYRYLIEDMFETITLYDNRCEDAIVEEMPDGRYVVSLDLSSHKARADGRGAETEIEHDDWIEIGVYGEKGEDGEDTILYMEKHRLESGANEIEVVVDAKPVRAGIDPRHLLIDRVPDDNVKRVTG